MRESQKHVIVNVGTVEDVTVTVRQIGRYVIVHTERKGVALSMVRKIVDALTKTEEKPAGFRVAD